jgi:hypothetical protein
LYDVYGAIKIVPNLIDPEPHHVPTELQQSLIPDLTPPAQLAVPVAMVVLSIDLDSQTSLPLQQGKIEHVPVHWILWHWTNAHPIQGSVELALPFRYAPRVGNSRILRTEVTGRRCGDPLLSLPNLHGIGREAREIVHVAVERRSLVAHHDQGCSGTRDRDVEEVRIAAEETHGRKADDRRNEWGDDPDV